MQDLQMHLTNLVNIKSLALPERTITTAKDETATGSTFCNESSAGGSRIF